MDKLEKAMKEYKKTVDSNINTVNRDLLARITKLEADTEIWKEQQMAFQAEMKEWKNEKAQMQEEINLLKAKLESMDGKEDGEITETEKEAMKEAMREEITKALTETMEEKIEAKREGWVEVVKKKMKAEVIEETKEERKLEGTLLMNATIEEERMRQARKLNVRVTGLEETNADHDGKELCTKLGYENPPFVNAWWVGKDPTKRALMLKFNSMETKVDFMRKRVALRTLQGDPIYLDDDLTVLQVKHRQTCMPKIKELRKEGKKVFYRDGRIFVDGKPLA